VSRAGLLGLAGFAAIAVSFGPARAGYGLFLPDFRDEFGLSIQTAGFIASGLQAGYLISLTLVGLLVARTGPRPMVLAGMLAGGVGMANVALAPGALWLAAGIILAGTSAGWSWAPYNDAVDDAVPRPLQGRVLSVISTGTTFGVLGAGLTALAAGGSWRVGWFVFAAVAFGAAAVNVLILPAGSLAAESVGGVDRSGLATFARPEAASLYTVAVSFGVVSAFYWAFAVDLVSGTLDLPFEMGPLFYAVVGSAGFAGLLTGDAVNRFGLAPVRLGILASLTVACGLLALAADSVAASGVSAVLYGVGVMAMSSLLALWSSLVFAEQSSTGFSVTLFLFGLGCVAGPAALGTYGGQFGLPAAFLVSAAITLLTTSVAFLLGQGRAGPRG
jgi:predicted MFS family arabinose efflux permease